MKLHRLFSILVLLMVLLSAGIPRVSVSALAASETPAKVGNVSTQSGLGKPTENLLPVASASAQSQAGGEGLLCGPSGVDSFGAGCVEDPAHVAITKVAKAGVISRGETARYTITVKNDSAIRAKYVKVNDVLPVANGLKWSLDLPVPVGCKVVYENLNCYFTYLDPGESRVITVSSPTDDVSCGDIKNTAKTWGANFPEETTAPETITVQCKADVTVTKKAEATSVNRGDVARFIITVKNISTEKTDDVVMNDSLPALAGISWSIDTPVEGCSIDSGTLTCKFGTLDPGETRTVTISSPTDEAKCCCSIINTAQVSASNELDANKGNNNAKATITVKCPTIAPHLEVIKTADKATINLNETLGFTIEVSNTGTDTAKGVTLKDQLASGLAWDVTPATGCTISAGGLLDCNLGDLAAGGKVTLHVSATSTTAACGTVTNTASAQATNNNKVDSNPATVEVTCPTLPPHVEVIKTADNAAINLNDPLGFTIQVSNTSGGTAKNVTVEDQLNSALVWQEKSGANCTISAGGLLACSLGDLPVGQSVTLHVTAISKEAVCGDLTNVAYAQADNNNGKVASNPAVITVDCPPPPVAPNLTVTKTVDARTVSAGALVGFTITVNNTGNGQANSVVLDDPLDNRLTWTETTGADCKFSTTGTVTTMTCNLGNIPGSGFAKVHIQAVSSSAACGDLTNIAYAEAVNFKQVPSVPVIVTIRCTSGINARLTKTVEKNQLFTGEPVKFTLTVSNDSTGPVNDVTLNDVLPTGAGLFWTLTSNETGLDCAIASGALNCNFGSMAPGVTHTLVLTSPTSNFPGGTIANTATITASNETAGNDIDNTATASTNVLAQACLSLDIYNGMYLNDFEIPTSAPIGIVNFKHDAAPKGEGFMGQYGNETVSLTVACLPDYGSSIRISFDLYILRSWDGNMVGPGPDHWKMWVNNDTPLLDTTFTNWSVYRQAYPDNYPQGDNPPQAGAIDTNSLGYQVTGTTIDSDAVYHVTYDIPYQPGQVITINFQGSGLQQLFDESWGIDNLNVLPLTNNTIFLPYTVY